MERITSRQNPLITRLRRLGAEKKTRRAQGVFLCEGTKLVGEALRWGPPPELLAVAEGTAPPAELPAGVRVVEVPEALLRAVSTVETPQGMLAVCRTPDTAPPETLPEGRLLVLDGVQDPGNVGTVWRTADAFGAAGLFLLPGCAEPFAPKTVRATMGACFRLPVWEGTLEDLTGLLATLKGLPTAYARDLQEDKEAVFDQVDTLEVLLPAFTGMVRTMHFDGDRLEEEAPTGFALATDIAEWLVKNGVPFRHAHELSGACVKLAEGRGQELWDLTDNDFTAFLPADKAPGVREVLSSHGSVDSRNGKGGTAYGRVREQIADAKAEVEELKLFPASTSDGSAYKAPGTF